MDEHVIVREVRIAAPPETVFRFFTDPARLTRWKGRSANVEPHPGGSLVIDFGDGNVMSGQFVELDPPRRVVFTWGWTEPDHPVPPGSSRVEVTLTPEEGGTVVRLEHSGLPEPAVEEHARGWDYFLPRLGGAAEADAGE